MTSSVISTSTQTFTLGGENYTFSDLTAVQKSLGVQIETLPFSIRILLESVLRNCDGFRVTAKDVENLAKWNPVAGAKRAEVPFLPGRVLLQDFTGVPAVVDLAAMREAMSRLDGDPKKINPLIPVDLVIDHSVQTDCAGSATAFQKNVDLEFQRNRERYSLLRWAQESLANFRVIPPSVGIIHQVNLEYLASVVSTKTGTTEEKSTETGTIVRWVFPDTVLGTDSHTVMINGLGVLGWGVGGIEAEAVMLGQPYYMLAPDVLGLELVGSLRSGVTATDCVLALTQILRREGVVGKFVEFFGEGVDSMPVATRAVLANMAPEYGATMGFFPVDSMTLQYLRDTGRPAETVELVETYCKRNHLFRDTSSPVPNYSTVLTFDLSEVEPCLAGPRRPQDCIPLTELKQKWCPDKNHMVVHGVERPVAPCETYSSKHGENSERTQRKNGDVVIAAITSCTNTSNPELMLAAGILAKNAVAKGLTAKPYVKTSLAPGSRVVTDYLTAAGLMTPLETLGFHLVGYGCLTCIGNSGPLKEGYDWSQVPSDTMLAAVLSGNRNFEGRIHPQVKANFLASPPLVVAFAIAGTVDIDFETTPLGQDGTGKDVYLRDIWPKTEEVAAMTRSAVSPKMYCDQYHHIEGGREWQQIPATKSELFEWNRQSTYIQEPPFLQGVSSEVSPVRQIHGARVLAALGDSVTTDHISPAGSIKPQSPAGSFLRKQGVTDDDFNSYGARRGNDRVMVRGTFANVRLKNQLVPDIEGGVTVHFPSGETMSIYDAAMKYQTTGTPLIILAGKEYGTGSSRDWAAKGTALLGVRAVLAASFERIHRGNLVGMGVLPLEFLEKTDWQSLGLTGDETFFVESLPDNFQPGDTIRVRAEKTVEKTAEKLHDGDIIQETEWMMKVRIDTPVELEYYRNGGILQTVLRKMVSCSECGVIRSVES